MSVSADMYLVISLMFAVFAAVAAVGTSLVLGAGFERLRAGFEIVKRQTAFFADAIHKLDNRTQVLEQGQAKVQESVAGLEDRVERVEKQGNYFFETLHALEEQMHKGADPKTDISSDITQQDLFNELPEVKLDQAQIMTVANDIKRTDVGKLLGYIHFDDRNPDLVIQKDLIEDVAGLDEMEKFASSKKESGFSGLLKNYLYAEDRLQANTPSAMTFH